VVVSSPALAVAALSPAASPSSVALDAVKMRC